MISAYLNTYFALNFIFFKFITLVPPDKSNLDFAFEHSTAMGISA